MSQKKAAEILAWWNAGGRFTPTDWPPMFKPQAATAPPRVSPVVAENMRRGRELQAAARAQGRRPALWKATGTPFSPENTR